MISKLLVPTDFSDQAQYAFEVACQLAHKHQAQLHLLHLVELPYSLINIFDNKKSPDLPEALYFLKLAQQNFYHYRECCKHLTEGLEITENVKFNDVQEGIQLYIKEHNIDAVVMGSHGSSGFEELFIGSNTEKVVRNVHVPVFVIKKQHPHFVIKKFIFATDLEQDNIKAVQDGIRYTEAFNAEFKLVYINTPEQFKTTAELREQYNQFKAELDRDLYDIEIYNDHNVERGILNFAKEQQADLIGIGTHGRKGLAHFLNGSLSEDLVNHAKRPVLTFRI